MTIYLQLNKLINIINLPWRFTIIGCVPGLSRDDMGTNDVTLYRDFHYLRSDCGPE
jgi:hypothetical protein